MENKNKFQFNEENSDAAPTSLQVLGRLSSLNNTKRGYMHIGNDTNEPDFSNKLVDA